MHGSYVRGPLYMRADNGCLRTRMNVAVWSSCTLAHNMRAHADCRCGTVSSADLACGSSRPAARCSTAAACNRRTVSRTRAAAAAGTGARIPARDCSQGTRFARTSMRCTRSSTMSSRRHVHDLVQRMDMTSRGAASETAPRNAARCGGAERLCWQVL